jgi:hypothetical protein
LLAAGAIEILESAKVEMAIASHGRNGGGERVRRFRHAAAGHGGCGVGQGVRAGGRRTDQTDLGAVERHHLAHVPLGRGRGASAREKPEGGEQGSADGGEEGGVH